MLPALIQRPGRTGVQRSQERGVTLLLVAVAMFSIIWMAGMSIDVGTLYQASAEAQRSADAAALAGARVLSSSGMTGDPGNSGGKWATICDTATQIAKAVANQNSVGGAVPSTVDVTFIAGDKDSACSASTLVSFGVNPTITVKVTQSSLPTYFSRVWGRTGSTVSATATAEAFNPSNAGSYAVQPRCVKPWIVPNYDPLNGPGCTKGCKGFVDPTSGGSIVNPGLLANGHVIGEQFWLLPVCKVDPAQKGACAPFRSNPPQANYIAVITTDPPLPNLEYLPGQVPPTSTAVPSSKTGACSDVTPSQPYAEAIAGCDQSTRYQCGVTTKNAVDVSENPGNGDTGNGVQCLIHQGTSESTDTLVVSGQDTLDPFATSPTSAATYPFEIQAGTENPLTPGVSSGTVITSSTSIVSVPIYDPNGSIITTGTTNVTIVGFLQVFINFVDKYGNVYVTVMNVTGCASNPATVFTGTSPVPVRLITSP
jgi:Flp pilus assembly protein TadG